MRGLNCLISLGRLTKPAYKTPVRKAFGQLSCGQVLFISVIQPIHTGRSLTDESDSLNLECIVKRNKFCLVARFKQYTW